MVLHQKQLLNGLKKNQFWNDFPKEVLIKPLEDDILEFDEMWSFVQTKGNKAWLWFAICRRTKQIVSWHLGKRNQYSANEFFRKIPKNYRHCKTKSDMWHCYESLSKKTHELCEKGTGETSYIEGFNNIIRQRLARFVRKTCSFSKKWENHKLVVEWFIREYNLEMKSVMV